ncbi:hypothetical protein C8F04DRAFT_321688 [Mycena alexandri]|uniref:Uncharacterized protein n=1 Tax=Mycena alexandri TaxID=1745969 RepID=A0AAD6X784_9AGAR|nr:hypothetical protein C8F04DRAFT_321688 [Mycena alexandri]
MPAKGHRTPALARAHSRSTSATKLPINLQFTQKKVLPRPKPPHGGAKQRAGFHIASPGDDDDEEEEAWVSSESGAATPNPHNDEDSDLDSGESNDPPQPIRVQGTASRAPPELPRVATARPSDYRAELDAAAAAAAAAQRKTPATLKTESPRVDPVPRIDTNAYRDPPLTPTLETAPPSQPTSPSRRRYSTRPMSSHSVHKLELRPHPLIRGQSFGQPFPAPKPSPLLPVAVTEDADVSGHLTASPVLSTSPTSPFPPASLTRRTSISSARSVATVATNPPPRSVREARHRTFSTLSTASSSAALSSLTHLPVSRSATPQMLAFFPPANPHLRVDDIHPLLPPPYVSNHLTVLARRTPILEAFDRVVRARQTARV